MNENLKIIAEFVDRASAGLQRAGQAVNNFTSGVRQSAAAQTAQNAALRAGAAASTAAAVPMGALVGALGGLVAGIGAAALAMDGFVNAMKEADRLDDLAEKTGTTAANLRDLSYAATLSGSSLDGILGAMNKLGKAADLSDEAATKQAQTFKQLGVSATDANGKLKNSEQLFMELADAFAGIEDGPEKSAAAFRLFGGEAKNLMPLLNKGSEGIKAMKEEAAALSGVAPEAFNAFAASSAGLYDNIDKVGTVSQGFFATLGNELLPVVNLMIEAFLDSAKEGGFLRSILNGLVETFKFMIPFVKAGAEAFSGLVSTIQIAGKSIGAVMAAIAVVASGGGIEGLKRVWSDYKADVQSVAQAHVTFSEKLNGTGHEAVKLAANVDTPKRSIASLKKEVKETETELQKFIKTLETYQYQVPSGLDPLQAARAKDILGLQQAYDLDIKKGVPAAKALRDYAAAMVLIDKNSALRAAEARDEASINLQKDIDARYDALRLADFEATLVGKSADERERMVAAYEDQIKYAKVLKTLEGHPDEARAKAVVEQTLRETAAVKATAKEVAIANQIFDQSLEQVQKGFTQRIQIALRMYEQGKISLDDFTRYQQEQFDNLLKVTENTAETSKTFWEEAAKGMQDAMQTFFYDIMQGNMTNLVDDFQKMISKMVAQALAAKLGEKLFGAGFEKTGSVSGGWLASAASWFGNMFGGARALGGPVSAGKAYIVGENRPELFVPNTSGTIMPSTEMLGNAGVTVQMHVSAVDSQSFLGAMNNVKRDVATMIHDATRQYNLGR